MLVNERGNIVADVEDEPDGDEPSDAVKINLHEISDDVSIEKSHCGLNSPTVISVLKSEVCAKS